MTDRVLWHDGSGAPQLIAMPPRPPDAGEVRYRVEAFALNHAELLYLADRHSVPTVDGTRLGYEACGVVDAVGPGVTRFAVGDRVASIPFASHRYGVNGSWAITPAEWLAPVPADRPVEIACSIWMQYLTAYYPLRHLTPIGPDDAVLITAASSSAAIGAMQMARGYGSRTIGVSRGGAKRDRLIALGYDAVIELADPDLAAAVKDAAADRPVRIVCDAVGGALPKRYAPALATGATIYVYGALGGSFDVRLPLIEAVRRDLRMHAYSTPNFSHDPGLRAKAVAHITDNVNSGRLRPVIDRVFAFDDVLAAYDRLRRGDQLGKVVVRL